MISINATSGSYSTETEGSASTSGGYVSETEAESIVSLVDESDSQLSTILDTLRSLRLLKMIMHVE